MAVQILLRPTAMMGPASIFAKGWVKPFRIHKEWELSANLFFLTSDAIKSMTVLTVLMKMIVR